MIPLFYFDEALLADALKKCPGGTFMSGRTHGWDGWALSFFCMAITLLVCQGIARLRKPAEDEVFHVFSVFGNFGMISLCVFLIASAIMYRIAASSQICLAADGIHHRNLPWSDFQRHSWSAVSEIAVDCRSRRRDSDLYYTLTFKDGTELDIADAMPSWNPSPEFRRHLTGVPFRFNADVRPNCPMPYVDWIGTRP